MAENLKFLKGSSNNWASMSDKSPNVFYVVQYGDDNFVEKYELYLGDKLIGDGTSLSQINNMLTQYATKAELTQGLSSKQDKGNYATMEQLSNKLDTSIYNSEKESFALKDDLGTKTDAADKNGSAFAQINWVKNTSESPISYLSSWQASSYNLRVAEKSVIIGSNGLSILKDDSSLYYVAYVSSEDSSSEFKMVGEGIRTFYTVDTSVLQPNVRVSFSKAIKKYVDDNSWVSRNNEKLLYSFYSGVIDTDSGLLSTAIIKSLSSNFASKDETIGIVKNIIEDGITISGYTVSIAPEGFGVQFKDGTYYAADATKKRTQPYEFSLGQLEKLVIDLSKLSNKGGRTELSDVVSVVPHADYKNSYLCIAYRYNTIVRLCGYFDDLYGVDNMIPTNTITNEDISDILFSTHLYAYKRGRKNNSYGEGTSWYKRFGLMNISDTHTYTGDDANGIASTDAETVKKDLISCAEAVSAANKSKISVLQTKGNHDVPNLTQKEIFDIVGNTVNEFTPNIQWGSTTNRMYGYADYTTEDMGTIRIIMLDPFDYDDGKFNNPYVFMSAVFSQTQIDWFISTIKDAALKGYHVVTMMHYSFGENSLNFNEDKAKPDALFYQDAFMIPDIINAAQKN